MSESSSRASGALRAPLRFLSGVRRARARARVVPPKLRKSRSIDPERGHGRSLRAVNSHGDRRISLSRGIGTIYLAKCVERREARSGRSRSYADSPRRRSLVRRPLAFRLNRFSRKRSTLALSRFGGSHLHLIVEKISLCDPPKNP